MCIVIPPTPSRNITFLPSLLNLPLEKYYRKTKSEVKEHNLFDYTSKRENFLIPDSYTEGHLNKLVESPLKYDTITPFYKSILPQLDGGIETKFNKELRNFMNVVCSINLKFYSNRAVAFQFVV